MEFTAEEKAFELFPRMLFSIKDPLKDFKKERYEISFTDYMEQNREALEMIEEAYIRSKEPEKLLEELAAGFINKVNEAMADRKKHRQEEAMTNYNMSIVIYVNPALLYHNKMSGKPLAEELLRQWKQNFPKTNLKLSDFETINNGFRRRYCYITTAVCESLNKPDDCYELTLLRDYRDHYLMKDEEGRRMIHTYYDIAPTIVKHIDREPCSHNIYEGIWKKYLSPCIRFIENNEKENCRVLYQKMVDELAEKYFKQEDIIA